MKLQLPPGPHDAYLFDCDGTIADSMPLHYIAWKKILAEWNCHFDEHHFYSLGGTPIAEIVSMLNKQHGLSMPVEAVCTMSAGLPLGTGWKNPCGVASLLLPKFR